MHRYGLPLTLAAGLLLAAALGALAGAHWAARRNRADGAGVRGSAEEQAATAAGRAPRWMGLPRFLTSGPEPPEERAGAAPATRSTRHARRLRPWAPPSDGPTPARAETGAEGPPPSPAAVTRARELRARLESAVAAHPGVQVRFADCSSGPCVARVESTQAAPIDGLVRDKQRLPPGFSVRARERLTAFNGRIFEADFVEQAPSSP